MATPKVDLSVQSSAIPSSTVIVSTNEQAEFKKFENLTAKLLRVPKQELDRKRRS